MIVRQAVPIDREVEVDQLIDGLSRLEPRLRPFDLAAIAVCRDFSRALLDDAEAAEYPDLQSLAFWMRPAEIQHLSDHHRSLRQKSTVVQPRGLVFHLPPSNVDTLFVYVWLLALLAGNRSIVRVSQRAQAQTSVIFRVLNRVLESQPDSRVKDTLAVIRYGHDEEITARISAHADARVIWGGDEAVQSIRSIAIPPHAIDLTFPDRFSLCAINSRAFLELGSEQRERLVEAFFGDAYWFDQQACGSPRLIVWCGEDADCAASSESFFEMLKGVVTARGYTVSTGTALEKKTYLDRATIDYPVKRVSEHDNRLAVLSLERVSDVRGPFCGGGVFFQLGVRNLIEIAEHVVRQDQTMTHFGFKAQELGAFVESVGGRGLDRIVPVGQALNFSHLWDGYDLLSALSRRVVLEV